jgi:Mn-dependent DtxR family transcriptional regulator
MNYKELQEEFEYLRTELRKELEQLNSSVISAMNNLERGKYYRLHELGAISRGEKIARYVERLTLLEKFLKK